MNVTLFSFTLDSTGSLVWTLAKGPLEVVAGLVFGAVFGALCWLLPHRESKDRPVYKFLLLFCLGALGMFGSHKVKGTDIWTLDCSHCVSVYL